MKILVIVGSSLFFKMISLLPLSGYYLISRRQLVAREEFGSD
jgi:hypothetical protein